jgi:nucleotide-binding universal stress UspA family protein
MQILAATDFSTRSNRAVRQAGLLAQSGEARLHIVHVVDDDQPDALVRMEKGEAERLLAEQIGSMPELGGTAAHAMVVTGDAFDGILRAAAEVKPDLIVMGSHRKQLLLDIVVGTTIERVIRKGSYPVLMVNFEAQRKYERVVAPVDMSDSSANALRIALSMGLIGQGTTLLHAFDPIAAGKLAYSGSDKASVGRYIASERERATHELAAFLVAHDLQHVGWSLRVEDGDPMDVISKAVSDMRPDLLVMGTHGRSALMKAFVGSVTEEALRSLSVDILAVPPARK